MRVNKSISILIHNIAKYHKAEFNTHVIKWTLVVHNLYPESVVGLAEDSRSMDFRLRLLVPVGIRMSTRQL